jgi:hypothetical protein
MRRSNVPAVVVSLVFLTSASFGCTEGASNGPNDPGDERDLVSGRALRAGFTPERLEPAAWYVASAKDLVVAGDGTVRWTDRSGHARDATHPSASGAPELVENGWFGAPTVHFDGTRYLSTAAWTTAPAGANADFSVLAVMRSGAAVQSAVLAGFWDVNGGGVAWAGLNGSTGVTLPDLTRIHSLSDTQTYTSSHDLGDAPHVVVWRYDSSKERIALTVDGSTTQSNVLAPIDGLPPMPLVIGASSLFSTGTFVGDISELVLVGHAISDADVSNFTEYARRSWPNLPTEVNEDPCSLADGSASPEATRCDDGNAQTYGDHCSAGTCAGDTPRAGSPADLAPLAWYHAGAAEVALADGRVSTWFDRTPNHFDLSQGFDYGRPLADAHGWDGVNKPALKFGGHHLLRRTGWTSLPRGTDTFTLFAVLRSNPSSSAGVAAFAQHDHYSLVSCQIKKTAGRTALDLFRMTDNGEKHEFTRATDDDLGTADHVVIWRYSPEVTKLTVDGRTAAITETMPPGAFTPDELLVGSARHFAPSTFDGYLAELAVIPDALSASEVARLSRYAENEWGGITLCAANCAGKTAGDDDGCGDTCED